MITKRETILVQLENFERTASDPNRFFEKGIVVKQICGPVLLCGRHFHITWDIIEPCILHKPSKSPNNGLILWQVIL